MYLKSLVLKGFKSFVDRSVVSLEPGITVVVGPNGSGKSNISDAILWVLGEQSAKQLRGQSMEDVIFAGSSARQPAGVAEVDLVLDNSDGVLPFDFTEIAITRRMYRSGESEYLINGSPALLRDILDILHDTGIGRDTHSIISQGELTAIVEGKPEMRRDLIEEAAGILKHKKRKERSHRKLLAMDNNLDRVRDIEKEIARQLRPLERQAKRAQEFQDVDGERRELELQLAVDDLRGLQAEWEGMSKEVRESEAEIELARINYSERSQELEKLQKALEEKGLFVGDLAEQRGRCQSLLERIDANKHLLEEKSRNMVARASELSSQISQNKTRLAAARREASQLALESEQAQAAYEVFVKENAELSRESQRINKARSESDNEYNKLNSALRAKQRSADETRLALERSRQSLSTNTLEEEMLVRRLKQIEEQVSAAQGSLAEQRGRLEKADEELQTARQEMEQATSDTAKRQRLLEYAKADVESERDKHAQIRAEIVGIQEIDKAFESASPALSWVLTHESEFLSAIKPISELVSADEEYEQLVERLLGADIFGLVVEDAASAELIVERLLEETGGEGELALVSAANAKGPKKKSKVGKRLIDAVHCPAKRKDVVEALLGDVYVVDTISQALEAQAASDGQFRYATAQGTVVWPNGKITIGVQSSDVEGVLARGRRLDELKRDLETCGEKLRSAEMAVTEAEQGLKASQEEGVALQTKIAQLQSESDVVREGVGRLEQQITGLQSESGEVTRQRDAITAKMAQAQPLIEEYEARIQTLATECQEIEEQISAGSEERSARARASQEIVDRIQACKVGLAETNTKSVYLRQRVTALDKEVAELERSLEISIRTQASITVLAERIDPLYVHFNTLAEGVRTWASKLQSQAQLEQSDSATLRQTIEDARSSVQTAKEALDAKVEDAADIRIALGKLEAQVEAAVQRIVGDGDILLEDALQIPSPEDRNEAEDRLAKLKRKIGQIGPVNQVAMEQYLELKERHDYIASQVDDLEAARKALQKIDAAIDRKMRDQFLSTFEEVDANFQQIFADLFPGGHAHLEFSEPDNTDTSGVNIVAQPPGKKITKNSLMSGGEMSLAALALLFAVYRTRTVPFYVLDEVEAALDDTNMRRLVAYLDSMRTKAQFIIISHQRRTMEIADVLYGVSMQGDGVSKVVSQKLERAIAEFAEDATPEEIQKAIDTNPDFVRRA